MRVHFFRQTKRPWKPLNWFYRAPSDTDDVMGQGYTMLIVTIFILGIQFFWNEWGD